MYARPEDTRMKEVGRLRDRRCGIRRCARIMGAVMLVVTSVAMEAGEDVLESAKEKLFWMPAMAMMVSSFGKSLRREETVCGREVMSPISICGRGLV